MADYPAAYDAGRAAYDPKERPRNPYGKGSHAQAWEAGWSDGQAAANIPHSIDSSAADRQTMHDEAAHLWHLWNDDPRTEPTHEND